MAKDGVTPGYATGIAAVALAIAGYGFAFGVLAGDAGLDVATVLGMSTLAYSGSAQAVFVASLASGGPSAALLAAVVVNVRLVVYGAMARGVLAALPLSARLLGAHLATDETIALSSTAPPGQRSRVYWASGSTFFVAWAASTTAGAALGRIIAHPGDVGLDVTFPAVFVALLVPLLSRRRAAISALVAATATVVVAPFVPAGVPVLISVAAALAVLTMTARVGIR